MLSWPEFAKTYGDTHNILYDHALESAECFAAYQLYMTEQRGKHYDRVQRLRGHMQQTLAEAKRETHRARIRAMTAKSDRLVEERKVIQMRQNMVCELSKRIAERTPAELSPPPPQTPVRHTPPDTARSGTPTTRKHTGQRKTMLYTMKLAANVAESPDIRGKTYHMFTRLL
jgi:hypothetical protein